MNQIAEKETYYKKSTSKMFEHSTKPASILVIDDDKTVCNTISIFLKSKQYDVTTIQDPEQALSFLQQRPAIDLIFLDIKMPNFSGIDVLEVIRKDYTPLELPVIMLTVSEDTENIVNSLDAGANDYIIKPGTLPVLIARIENQLSIKSMNHALQAQKEKLEKRVINTEVAYELARANLESEMDNRLEVEKALHISEQRFEELFNNTPAMYLNIDNKGHIQTVNRFGAYMLGYKRNELIDKPLFSLYHPQDRNLARQYIKESLDDPDRLHRWELRKISKQGNPLPLRETVRSIKQKDGKTSILMISIDVATADKSEQTINLDLSD